MLLGCPGVVLVHIYIECLDLLDSHDRNDIAKNEECDGESDADIASDTMHFKQPQHHEKQGGCNDQSQGGLEDP